jgi:hypothetical protein
MPLPRTITHERLSKLVAQQFPARMRGLLNISLMSDPHGLGARVAITQLDTLTPAMDGGMDVMYYWETPLRLDPTTGTVTKIPDEVLARVALWFL